MNDIHAMTFPPGQIQDIVFITVKSFDTAAAAMEALPMVGPDTTVMLQDIVRGKRTEIDYTNGAVVKLGDAYGINTPYNNAIVMVVQAKEGLGIVNQYFAAR